MVGDAPLLFGSMIGDQAGAGFIAEVAVMWGMWPVMVGEKEWLYFPVKYARISVKYADGWCSWKYEKRGLENDARDSRTSYKELWLPENGAGRSLRYEEILFLEKYARRSEKYADGCFLKYEKRPTRFVGVLVKDARGSGTSYEERFGPTGFFGDSTNRVEGLVPS